jgi:hypothetical protein
MKPGGREEIILLASDTAAGGRRSVRPARFSVQQLTSKGEVVGGSTFVFKPAKG